MKRSDGFNARMVGPQAGHVVVLGHGFGSSQSIWSPQVAALTACGYRVLTFDFAGATPYTEHRFQPTRHNTLYGFAEDLYLLLTEMRVRGATYVGHSLGGMAGVLAENGDPGLFDGLILIGVSAHYLDEPATGYVGGFTRDAIDAIVAAMRDNYIAWVNGFVPRLLGGVAPNATVLEFIRRLQDLRPDIAAAMLGVAFLSDHRADVERLTLPVQVLQTEADPAVPLAAAQWLARHGRAQDFTLIPTQGHFPHVTAPLAVNAAILGFLDTCLGH